ncbi:MAG: peptidylprolyl isomerase, partial [Thermoguttaceae bacterium]|nr:peptidylprolyl isomerase [Thermoguttaceae bacterium]
MSFSSQVRRFFSASARRDARREARRRQALNELRSRRLFEILESRQLLDGAGAFESLPDSITISSGDSYHYAFEGLDAQIVDAGSLEGLTASLPTGTQVAFTVTKTATDGAVSTLGEIVLQLFEAEGEAPNSSSHFLKLVDDGYYEGKTFHRIYAGFMFQGGSSDGSGYLGAGQTIVDEHSDVLTHSGAGIVAFANKGANTSDAQIYITFDQASWLDGKYNVFGYVVDGYDVIEEVEKAQVVANASGEKSKPVETYQFKDVRVLDASEVENGALRIVANQGVSGETTISVSGTAADGSTQFKEITVKVVDAKELDALIPTEVEMVAGETKTFELPAEYAGSKMTYQIYTATGLEGVTIELSGDDGSTNVYKVKADLTGAQATKLTIVAKSADGAISKTYNQMLYVAPATPEFSFVDDVKHVELKDGSVIVASNSVDSALTISVVSYSDEATTLVKIDGVQRTFSVVSKTVDAKTGKTTYVLQLSGKEAEKLADGEHTISVSQYLPIDNIFEHEPLYGETVETTIFVDTEPLEFTNVDADEPLVVFAGETGELQILTNKVDADGNPRSDVQILFGDAIPSCLTLTADGLLKWSGTEECVGSYQVELYAKDGLGNEVRETLRFTVVEGPLYDVSGETKVDEGGAFEITISVAESELEDNPADPYAFEIVKNPEFENADDANFTLTTNEEGTSAVFAWTTSERLGPGVYEFSVKLTGTDGATSYVPLKLTVGEVNEAPSIKYDGETTLETNDESKFELQLEATDADLPAQELTWTLSEDAPSWLTLDAETGKLTADAPVAGDYTFEVVVSDGDKSSEALKLTLKVAEVDRAPVFDELEETTVETGKTFEATIVAKDPNTAKNNVFYELVGDDYPEDVKFNASTGKISWAIPADYLDATFSAQTFKFTVKATERVSGEDGKLENGLSTEKTFEILISNANFDATKAAAPEWTKPEAQKATAGTTFETTVEATAPKDAAGVRYELVGDKLPEGLKIDAETGKISWAIPKDYVADNSVESVVATIKVKATTIVESEKDGATSFGGSAETTIELTVANPNFKEEAIYTDWAAWLDAWVANAQARLEGSAANLQEYLDAYLTAVDERDAALKSAQADYAAGKTSLTDFLKKRAEIQSTFSQTTTDARADLAEKDAAVEETYRDNLESLNDAYDKLAASGEIGAPGSIREEAKAAAGELSASTESSDANFHLKNNSTGAKVATDLTSVLKLWRSGYSSSTIYDEIFGGGFDAEEDAQPESGDKNESGENSGENSGESGENGGENSGENGENGGENSGENGENGGENSGENGENG